MTENLINWLFWVGAAVASFGIVSASVRYVNSRRIGHRIMAAQAVLQTLLCIASLLALMMIRQNYPLD